MFISHMRYIKNTMLNLDNAVIKKVALVLGGASLVAGAIIGGIKLVSYLKSEADKQNAAFEEAFEAAMHAAYNAANKEFQETCERLNAEYTAVCKEENVFSNEKTRAAYVKYAEACDAASIVRDTAYKAAETAYETVTEMK